MSNRESILQRAEAFVKTVVEKDFKQKVDAETLRAAAIKASSGIPISRASPDPRTPIEELVAGDAFRQTMIPKADDPDNLMWHGWVIMDAFLAGIKWERNRSNA